ncbi:MAG: hypothetical protein Salg2KO_22880 [Salibacteraceae bacterium]
MLKDIDFKSLSRQERNAAKRIRLLALAHFKEGMNRSRIALTLKVSRRSVNNWVSAFLENGLAGLDARPPPGRPPSLTPEQRTRLSRYVEFQSQSDKGGRLTGEAIREWIASELGIEYKLSNVYRLLHEMGFSWLSSRSRHPRQSEQAQEEFKKTGF